MDQNEIAALRTLLTEMSQELTSRVTKRDALDPLHSAAAREMLGDVRMALTRIEYGSYGTCLNCDHEISASRLRALPWTSLCILCRDLGNGRRCARPDLRGVRAA